MKKLALATVLFLSTVAVAFAGNGDASTFGGESVLGSQDFGPQAYGPHWNGESAFNPSVNTTLVMGVNLSAKAPHWAGETHGFPGASVDTRAVLGH